MSVRISGKVTSSNVKWISIKFNKSRTNGAVGIAKELNKFLTNNINRWPPINQKIATIQSDLEYYQEYQVYLNINMTDYTIFFQGPIDLVQEFFKNHKEFSIRRSWASLPIMLIFPLYRTKYIDYILVSLPSIIKDNE